MRFSNLIKFPIVDSSNPSGPSFTYIAKPVGVTGLQTFQGTVSFNGDQPLSISPSDIDEATTPPPPTNKAPTVFALGDISVTLPAEGNLSGSVTDDGLPYNILSTTWTMVSGPGTVVFGSPYQLITTVSFTSAGIYLFRLTASDGQLSGSADVTMVVNSASGQTTLTYDQEGFNSFKNLFIPQQDSILTINYAIAGETTQVAPAAVRAKADYGSTTVSGDVEMVIYDQQGTIVKKLEVNDTTPGVHPIQWDGRNEEHTLVASGTYLIVMTKGSKTYKTKFVVVK
jgi:hypothetical protein